MRKGFTLVEMLIVISIVGILATIAVGEYSRFRKTSVLELTSDGVVSALNEARDQAKWGKVSGDVGLGKDKGSDSGSADGAKCYGLQFSTVFGVIRVTADFDTGKEWDAIKNKWVYKGCKEDVQEGMALELNESLSVLEVNGSQTSCEIFYMPPNGDVFQNSSCKGIADKNLTVVLGYKDDTDTSYQRKVLVDFDTGIAKILTLENAIP